MDGKIKQAAWSSGAHPIHLIVWCLQGVWLTASSVTEPLSGFFPQSKKTKQTVNYLSRLSLLWPRDGPATCTGCTPPNSWDRLQGVVRRVVIFGLMEARVPWENPHMQGRTHERREAPGRADDPGTFLLWGGETNHYTTMPTAAAYIIRTSSRQH